MKATVDLSGLKEAVAEAVDEALIQQQAKLSGWKFFTLKETAELLQVKISTLLDKRMPYLRELEYARHGKIFWFLKTSVEKFISSRCIKRYVR